MNENEKKEWYNGIERRPTSPPKAKAEKKPKASELRTSIYLDQYRRNMVKAYYLMRRSTDNPLYRVKNFYEEAVDRMIAENPHLEPYEGNLI